jgi:hypothetical protein
LIANLDTLCGKAGLYQLHRIGHEGVAQFRWHSPKPVALKLGDLRAQ